MRGVHQYQLVPAVVTPGFRRFWLSAVLVLLLVTAGPASATVLNSGGLKIWYRVAGGRADEVPTVYLHGGPGYHSYTFEQSIGPTLERSLRMVYLDQRGCGRSSGKLTPGQLTLRALVDDLEQLRKTLNARRINLIGHSFGGIVALAYARRYPRRLHRLVLVEISHRLRDSLRFQVREFLRRHRQQGHKSRQLRHKLKRIAGNPSARLIALYRTVGRRTLQTTLHFHDPKKFDLLMTMERRFGIWRGEQWLPALIKAGFVDRNHRELTRLKRRIPTLLVAGVRSGVIGGRQIRALRSRLGARLIWFKNSGHFPHLEEPGRFARVVSRFLSPRHKKR